MLPIKYHLEGELEPDSETKLQLENLAQEKDLYSHIAVMPDVHSKSGRKCPTGTVAAASHYLFPQILDTAPNCGMRLILTPWKKGDLSKETINEIFLKLVSSVPTRTYIGNVFSYQTILDICRLGSKALLKGANGEAELNNIYRGGNFFATPPSEKEILNSLPRIFLYAAQLRLGILGEAGNHFLDLVEFSELNDPKKAALFGIEKGSYAFLMHTGSGIMGQYASYFFTPKKEEHLSMKLVTNLGRLTFRSQAVSLSELIKLQKEVKNYRDKKEYFRIDPETAIGKTYLTAHRAAANFGFANRTVIMQNIKRTLEGVLGKTVELKVLCDIPHVFVEEEEYQGKKLFVHRNGASRGYGPEKMKDHSLFSQTGEPGILAGSMSTPSYFVAGTDQNHSTFFSINHGAGKSPTAKSGAPRNKEELSAIMEENKIKLYNARSKGVVYQSGKYYKDINTILKSVQDFNIASPIAKMQPVAVLMA